MTFEQWLEAKGFDHPTLSEVQKGVLVAAWQAETGPKPEGDKRGLDEIMAAARVEEERVRKITQRVAESVREFPGRLQELEQIGRLAIEGKWAEERTELELLRASRTPVTQPTGRDRLELNDQVIEAAVCMAGRFENLEKDFPAPVLEAAQRRWPRGLGLGELILTAAHRNGYRGLSIGGDLNSVLKAAFAPDVRAAITGPSTYTLPNILANIANKFLRVGFEAVDDAWRSIALIGNVNDFKTKTTPTLTGSLIYKQVPASGELKHGDIGERVYTNQASTYGRMLGIDRRDLVNDDLGALTSAGRRLGRGAALKVNDIFWSVFLNNSTFFAAGNNNVTTGAGSALSLAALQDADRVFRLQTDPDGQPLGVMPALLVVPSALRITALNIINGVIVVSTTTANAPLPNANAFAGTLKVVSSPYMSNAAYTGNSATAWYLLANPQDLPTIEIAFLNNVDRPTVETADADFNMLGIAMRGFFDFGVALQEFRAGVRAAGT